MEIQPARFCRMETETVQHIICCCEALARQHYNVFGKLIVEPKDISTASVRDLCRFIRGTGLLNLCWKDCLGLYSKPKAVVHPERKLMGPKKKQGFCLTRSCQIPKSRFGVPEGPSIKPERCTITELCGRYAMVQRITAGRSWRVVCVVLLTIKHASVSGKDIMDEVTCCCQYCHGVCCSFSRLTTSTQCEHLVVVTTQTYV